MSAERINLSTPLKVGLTGGIGSGKSTVAAIFETLNVPVYYADAETKALYISDDELRKEIASVFGEDIYHQGTFRKEALAKAVFSDPQKLAQLNRIVHPRTIQHAERWMAAQTAPYVIKEAALIFESGSSAGLDLVIGVSAPDHIRINRTMKRDNISREEVIKRIRQQVDQKIKMSLCDFVIENDGSKAVIPQVLAIHQQLLSLSGL